MPDGINPARHPANNDQASRGKFPPKPLRHLRAIKCWPPGAHDAEAGQIQYLRIASNVQQNWRVVDLQ